MEIFMLVVVLVVTLFIWTKTNSLARGIEELRKQLRALEKQGRPSTPVAPAAVEQPVAATPPPVIPEPRREPLQQPIPPRPTPVVRPVIPAPPRPKKPKDPDAPKSPFVRFFTENILTKIGIVTLILGIAFFVKYAIDQDWINEIGRVAIGILTGGIIIGVAHRLRKEYTTFSSILVGGGISVFYITITLAFREYAIFGQTTAFVLLIVTTVLSVLLSLYYNRRELAIFSLAGGFAAPFMVSTGEGNHIVLFSYILLLNAGMLTVAFRKQWRIIGLIAFVGTYILLSSWLGTAYRPELRGSVMGFIAAFYVQFYLVALFDHKLSGRRIAFYQVSVILANNLFAFLSMLYVAGEFKGLVTFGFALANAATLAVALRQKERDVNMIYLTIALVLSFVSLVVPIQLEGHVITMFWALETVILLWLWRKSGIEVFRIGFAVMSALVGIAYLIDVAKWTSATEVEVPILFNSMVATGAVVLVCAVATRLLLRGGDPEEAVKVRGQEICRLKHLRWAVLAEVIFYAFIVPMIEIAAQSKVRCPELQGFLGLTWMFVYLGILNLCLFCGKRNGWSRIIFCAAAAGLYAVAYLPVAAGVRDTVFAPEATAGMRALFALHIVALAAAMTMLPCLWRSSLRIKNSSLRGWATVAITALTVVIATVGMDNIVLSLCGMRWGGEAVMHTMNLIVHPVLWALMATALMVRGLRVRDALLRQISLGFFLLIIAKFYAYDVWRMSQAGRIVSFVLLGVILLLVSFLQQKIKTLIKDETDTQH